VNTIFIGESSPLPSSKTASTLVFYDWSGPLNRDRWLELCVDFFSLLGSTANAVSYRQGDSATRKSSINSLAKVIKKPDIQSVEVHELEPPYGDFNSFRVYAGFNIRGRKRTAIFSHNSSHIDIDLFCSLTQKFSQAAVITYGHGFLRPISRGPVMFAYDLSYSSDNPAISDPTEELEMNLWRQERLDMIVQNKRAPFRHLHGFLRDIYQINILTIEHLQSEVSGKKLVDWIESGIGRGYLQEVACRVWVWVLPAKDIVTVRGALADCGLLISKLPNYE